MAGISSKAAGITPNKEKTFQDQRFDDDLGLNWVQFKWRNHDPQIGRFIEIDPLANDYVYNSTYAFSENQVTAHVELEGLEKVPVNSPGDAAINLILEWADNFKFGKQDFNQGLVKKAEVVTGGNEHLPPPVQQIKAIEADLQINAGMAQMVKPGLEAGLMLGSSVAGSAGVSSSPSVVTASNFGLKGRVSFGNSIKLGGTTTNSGNSTSTVYRVFGGDAKPNGFSWTPENPGTVGNFRDVAGLPSGGASGSNNTGRFIIEGSVQNKNIIDIRSALPLDGNKGGLTEWLINPKNVNIKKVSGVNPAF